jgi:hypothetical protein
VSRRLVTTKPGYALYEYDGSDGYGRRAIWEPLKPNLPNIGEIAPLASPGRPISSFTGGLYDRGESPAERRSRGVDALLAGLGIRPSRRRTRKRMSEAPPELDRRVITRSMGSVLRVR